MPSFIQYLLKLSISVALVYLFYQLFLCRLTFYNWNRWYLLGYSLLSFFIPFIDVASFTQQNNIDNTKVIRFIPVIENYTTAPVSNISPANLPAYHISGWPIFYMILVAGSLLVLLRLVIQFISLQKIKRNASVINDAGTIIYHVEENIAPFSFGNAIYLNKNLHSESELREIILHEYVHVKEKHTADIFFSELLCIVNWFNPCAWLIRHAIRQNLEFIADNQVLKNGIEKKSYQYHLLKVVGTPHYRIANSFNFSSLQKRIAMMNKIKSARLHLLRFLFVLPLLAVLLLAFRNTYEGIVKKRSSVCNNAGIVLDAATNKPLANVIVVETNSGVTATTDEKGFYSMKIPEAKDSLKLVFKLKKDGYQEGSNEYRYAGNYAGFINVLGMFNSDDIKNRKVLMFMPGGKTFDGDPGIGDVLKLYNEIVKQNTSFNDYLKFINGHPEFTLYSAEGGKGKIVIFKDGTYKKYGYENGPTIEDMEKKYGPLPDMMKPVKTGSHSEYLAKWEKTAEVAEKKFHTDNPNVYEIIFPGDSRAIAVPKTGKPHIYDLDNNVPEERPAFERLYGSLDGIVPPPTNNANGFYYDEKYKDWRVEGFRFLGFPSYELDSKTSVTHFKGMGFLKIDDPGSAKGLIVYNGKEYNAVEFCAAFGNGVKKFAEVMVYENKTAFDKFGEKGNHGVIVINDNSTSFYPDKNNKMNRVTLQSDSIVFDKMGLQFSGKMTMEDNETAVVQGSFAVDNRDNFPLVVFNGKELNRAENFRTSRGNYKITSFNKTEAEKKYGDKGVNGAVEIASLDTIPSQAHKTPPACISLFWDDAMDEEHKSFFARNKEVNLLNWLVDEDQLQIYFKDGSPETINLNDKNSVEKAIAKYGKLPKPAGSVSPQKQNNAGLSASNIDLTSTIVNGKMLANPMIIIDGIESDTSGLKKLDPSKKYFMFILQDSALLKPYGEKGKNGVVMLSQQSMILHQVRQN